MNTNIEVLQIGSVVAVFMQMMISLFPRSRLCCILLTATLCASGQTTDSPSFADDTSSPSTDSRATGRPTAPPSGIPSDLPSFAPSFTPTSEPSLDIESSAVERFRQQFSVENGGFFSQSEAILFQGLYATYTEVFASEEATVDGRVSTSCEVLSQKAVNRRLAVASRTHHGARVRRTQDEWIIEVDFNMEYTSLYLNVTTYPTQFQLHINSNLDRIPEQMQLLGLNVSEAFIASRIVIRPDPTPLPTSAPTIAPTKSASPSTISSHQPSLAPSSEDLPATESPSASPTPQHQGPSQKKGSDVILISVSVVLAAIIMILGGVVYQKKKSDRYQNNQVSALVQGSLPNHSADLPNRQQTVGTMSEPDQDHVGLLRAVASPSIPSNQSLLSIGISRGGDSVDEVDTTQDLADEFDEYKDQNLEKMRAGVEGNLMGFDGMMSQALTRALIDDDETNFDATELLWGGSRHLTGIEVEASALGEVADWLKRNETPADDERYVREGQQMFRVGLYDLLIAWR